MVAFQQQSRSSSLFSRLKNHLSIHSWFLAPYMGQMAKAAGHSERLIMEGFALSLWEELLNTHGTAVESSHAYRSTSCVKTFLQSGEADVMSMEGIGKHFGMSVSTLQRHCRKELGVSLLQYLRQRRLNHARQAIICEGISITEASLLAGYEYPANFITACKKVFGCTPGEFN